MLKIGQVGMGDWLGRHEAVMWNRTGATLSRGQVAMVDLLDTQAEVTAGLFTEGDELSVWASTTPVTQGPFEEGFPIVVALQDIADNDRGRFLLWGFAEVAVCDDDVSTTDVDRGDRLSMVVAESATAVQAFVTGGTGSRCVGIGFEDAAADSTVTARTVNASSHLRWCLWTGGVPVLGSTDT